MTPEKLTFIIAWILLIASWVIPFIKKGSYKANLIAFVISGISFGMFLSYTIYKFL